MNTAILSGVVKKPAVRGSKPKVLSFVLETRQNSTDSEKKERISLVPCVVFNPTPEAEEMLSTEGVSVEFEGRVSSSSYEVRGETRSTCEVIVRNWTLVAQPTFTTAD